MAKSKVDESPGLQESQQTVLNAVIDLESVPDSLKRGVVVPVYKEVEKIPCSIAISNLCGSTFCSIKI